MNISSSNPFSSLGLSSSNPRSKFNWRTTALVLSLIQALVMIGLESALLADILKFFSLGFGELQNTGTQAIALVYFTLFILAQLSYLLLVWNSVYTRNTLQVLATTIFNLLLFGYSIVQHTQVRFFEYLICESRF
jgi:hypothetical protein